MSSPPNRPEDPKLVELLELLLLEHRLTRHILQKSPLEHDVAASAERLWATKDNIWSASDWPRPRDFSEEPIGVDFINNLSPEGVSLAPENIGVLIRETCRCEGYEHQSDSLGDLTQVTNFDIVQWVLRRWRQDPDGRSDAESRVKGGDVAIGPRIDRVDFDSIPTTLDRSLIDGRVLSILNYEPGSVNVPHMQLRRGLSNLRTMHRINSIECLACVDRHGLALSHLAIAIILSLSRLRVVEPGFQYIKNYRFLNDCVVRWNEVSWQHRVGRGSFYARCPNPGRQCNDTSFDYGTIRYHMRSFSPEDFPLYEQRAGLLPCFRERVTLTHLTGDKTAAFLERRFSLCLNYLPAEEPAGHYTLLCVVDKSTEDLQTPGFADESWDAMFDEFHQPHWNQYDVHAAGLFTGISAFQARLCSYIDRWEADWVATLQLIDSAVSNKPRDLEDAEFLKSLIFDTTSEKSVMYFKTVQLLRAFANSVRDTSESLDLLARDARDIRQSKVRYHRDYPHMSATTAILHRNWNIVLRKQTTASKRILVRLERLMEEVNGLRDGLFSAQSVREASLSLVEAQKSRQLNKYLTVFTVVTIIFLPPTFVATFFGMDLFHSSRMRDTQTTFWAVFAAVSGFTYLMAALGLSGTAVSPKTRENWKNRVQKLKDRLSGGKSEEDQDQIHQVWA